MKLGIMQPYFFPYLGYYSLIKNTDRWIILDEVQFIRHGWIERNRVLKPAEGWQYISVPLQKHSRETLIKDIHIKSDEDWKGKIIRQLEHYKKRAPFYAAIIKLVNEALSIQTESLVELNANILAKTCEYLQIPFHVNPFSQMNLNIDPVKHAGEWALNISKALDALEYINPSGGNEIFNNDQFEKQNIKLSFLKNQLLPYNQRRESFEAGLSIIDVMMFNSLSEIKILLNQNELI
jgi:hypothetical protein